MDSNNPLGAVLTPVLVNGQDQEFNLATLLVVASQFFVGLFGYSMFVGIRAKRNKDANKLQLNNAY